MCSGRTQTRYSETGFLASIARDEWNQVTGFRLSSVG